jgi:hypothetical protein
MDKLYTLPSSVGTRGSSHASAKAGTEVVVRIHFAPTGRIICIGTHSQGCASLPLGYSRPSLREELRGVR